MISPFRLLRILDPAVSVVEIAIAILLFCRRLPPREHFGRRFAVVSLLTAAAVAVGITLGYFILPTFIKVHNFEVQILTWTMVLVLATLAVMGCYEVSIWTALFCCSAGYIVQNMASGLAATVRVLVYGPNMANSDAAATIVSHVICSIVVFTVAYRVLIHPIEQYNLTIVENRVMLLVMVLVILVNIVFDLVNKSILRFGVPTYLILLLRLVHLALCSFTLVMQLEMLYSKRLRDDVLAVERIRAEDERQLRLARGSIDAVNDRVAQIREQVSRLERSGAAVDRDAIERIERDVGVFDSVVRTGNDVIDVILAEKSLVCEREGITLTCIADGAALSFVSPEDLYSLLGNAIENAIDAVRAIDDPEKRAVGLVIRRTPFWGGVAINVENYYEGDLEFEDGLPKTTKGSTLVHGYGMRSMRKLVEGYGGTLTARAQDGVFHLNAIIPEPQGGDGA